MEDDDPEPNKRSLPNGSSLRVFAFTCVHICISYLVRISCIKHTLNRTQIYSIDRRRRSLVKIEDKTRKTLNEERAER